MQPSGREARTAPVSVDYASYFAKYEVMPLPVSATVQPTLWRTCRVLANRKRLQILARLIRQPNQTVSALAREMKLSMPAASQYLRALEARGLLTCRRVGLRVEYRPTASATGGAGGEILTALRFAFRGRAQPTEALFKLATAFTHPRRVEVFRALKKNADSFAKIQAATQISAQALSRHLAKLEKRGFVRNDAEKYVVTSQKHPFARALARLACQ